MTGYTNPGAGHLASLLAFNGAINSNNYLYRNLVANEPQLNDMNTGIGMNNNNITGANQLSTQSLQALANGSMAAPSVTLANGKVVSFNQVPEGGVLGLVGANGQSVYLESDNGMFRLVNSPWNLQLFSVDQSGNVVANGNISTGATVQGGTLYSTGNLQVNGSGQVNGNLNVSNTLQGGYVNSTGNVNAQGYVTVQGGASPGGACGGSAIGNGPSGTLLCESGVWKSGGGNITSVSNTIGTGAQTPQILSNAQPEQRSFPAAAYAMAQVKHGCTSVSPLAMVGVPLVLAMPGSYQ